MTPTLITTIVDRWRAAADVPVITILDADGPRPMTGAVLMDRIARAAGALAARGVRAGDRVGLIMPTTETFAPAFFATWWLNATPVPLAPPDPRLDPAYEIARLRASLATAGAKLAVAPALLVSLAPAGFFDLVAAEDLVDGTPQAEPMAGDHLAVIQFSSGSTGRPRGIALGFAQIEANVRAESRVLQQSVGEPGVSWLPLHHDMGLVGMLYTQFNGVRLNLIPPEQFIVKPARWIRALSDLRATITLGPNFAFALTAKLPPAAVGDVDLSALRIVMIGAEPIRVATMKAFIDRYAPHGLDPRAMMPTYGLAEAVLAVSITPPGTTGVTCDRIDRAAYERDQAVPAGDVPGALEVVACGPTVEGVSVEIRDGDGRRLPDRAVGEIWVRSTATMYGYIGDDEGTRAALQDGWLRTGDLGYTVGDQIYVSGRVKDLIIRGGAKFHPADLEVVAEGVAGVRGGGACCFPVVGDVRERVVMLVETRDLDAAGALPNAVRGKVYDASGFRIDEIVPVRAGSLPKTTSGKIRRTEARKRWLAGEITDLRQAGA